MCGEPLKAETFHDVRRYRDISVLRGIKCPASQKRIRASNLEPTLDPFINGLVLPPHYLERALEMLRGEKPVDVEAQRKSLTERRRRLLMAYESTNTMSDDEFKKRMPS